LTLETTLSRLRSARIDVGERDRERRGFNGAVVRALCLLSRKNTAYKSMRHTRWAKPCQPGRSLHNVTEPAIPLANTPATESPAAAKNRSASTPSTHSCRRSARPNRDDNGSTRSALIPDHLATLRSDSESASNGRMDRSRSSPIRGQIRTRRPESPQDRFWRVDGRGRWGSAVQSLNRLDVAYS
jgi:hypothetical protein